MKKTTATSDPFDALQVMTLLSVPCLAGGGNQWWRWRWEGLLSIAVRLVRPVPELVRPILVARCEVPAHSADLGGYIPTH